MSLVMPGRTAERAVGFKDRPEFQRLGIYVTAIPDAVYPWHSEDVQTIRRRYFPEFVPLFRRVVYRSPAGATLTFVHHGYGYYDDDSKREPDPRLAGVLMPMHCTWRRPNVMGFWFEPADTRSDSLSNRYGLPTPFVPWGDWIVNMFAESWEESAKEAKEALMKGASETERALDAAKEEARYTEREEAPKQLDALMSMTSTDVKEMAAMSQGWAPEYEPKPFVHLQAEGK